MCSFGKEVIRSKFPNVILDRKLYDEIQFRTTGTNFYMLIYNQKNRLISEVPTDVTRTRPGHESRMTVMCNTALIVDICKIDLVRTLIKSSNIVLITTLNQ